MPTSGTAFNSVTKAVTGNAYKKRNSATILMAGNFTSGNITNSLTLAANSYKTKQTGLPLVSTTWGRVAALAGGTFCYKSAASHWIMLGNSVTTQLSGVNTSVLKSGAADFFRKPIPFKTTARICFTSGIAWVASELEGPVFTITSASTLGSFGSDVAAALSATARSAVFYMSGKLTAVKTNYSNLTLW